MHRLLLAVLIPTVALFTVGCSDASIPAGPDPSKLGAASFAKPAAPPAADGVIAAGEYADGATFSFMASLPSGGTTPVTASITRDRRYLYLAVSFDRGSAFHLNDLIAFEFDNDNDGVREDGDDIVLTGPSLTPNVAVPGGDFYRFDNGASNRSDEADGGTIDAVSAFGVSGTTGTFEIRHDLDSSDNAHDFSIDTMRGAQTVGVIVQVSLESDPEGSNAYVHTFKPSGSTYCQLTIGKKNVAVTCPA
jgi:hypothetical protein